MTWRTARRRRATALALVVLGGLGLSPRPASATHADETTFILSTVRTDGSIAETPEKAIVVPYLANYAAMGLAQKASNPAAVSAAWAYFNWYAANQNADGTINNFAAADAAHPLVNSGAYDSSDGYAGTFLAAVWDLANATHDTTHLATLDTAVQKAVGAIHLTQKSDGLTWARPDYPVKYLMDQAEAFGGLRAAANIERMLGHNPSAVTADGYADQIKAGVAGLWHSNTQSYDWAVHDDSGFHQTTNWAVLYPDAMEQVWVAAWGLADTRRDQTIVNKLENTHYHWDEPAVLDTFVDGDHPNGYQAPTSYWPVGCWAKGNAGIDFWSAGGSLSTIRDGAGAANDGWPYTSGIAGQLLVADSMIPH